VFTNIIVQFRLSVAKIGTLLGGFALGFLVYLYFITRANPLNGFFGDSRAALFGLIVELAADMHHAGQRLPAPSTQSSHDDNTSSSQSR
jgi:predicted lipid-binding transport protein (Tim44 family)